MPVNTKRNKIKRIAPGLLVCLLLCCFCDKLSCDKLSTDDSTPEISILYNEIELHPDQTLSLISFSGNPMDIPFTIINKGSADLILTEYNLSSNNFTISKEPLSLIPENGETEFTIQFFSKEGSCATNAAIKSNDPDFADFTFNINCIKSNIEIYFSGPSYDLSLEEALIEKINDQSIDEYLDICVYGLDSESVINAVENAIAKGVHVRFVGDLDGDDTLEELLGNYYAGYYRIACALDAHFPVDGKSRTKFPEDNGFDDFNLINDNIMHNKFAIFTDESGNKYLSTGSANYTESDFKLNNNNSLIIHDLDLTGTYREQFEYLLGLPGREPVSEIRHHIIDNIPIDILFPPAVIEGKTPMNHLTDIAESAENNILFMIFSFTHQDLVNLIIDKYETGIIVKGIFDESQLAGSSEELLVRNGIPCRIDGNYHEQEDGHGGKLHHKTMILDDKITVTGSYNWSNNADTKNNENIVILYSAEIAKLYKDEWQKRWNEGRDITGSNDNNQTEYDYGNYQDIIINEVMWMGSRKSYDETDSRDEFIELRNLTNKNINLNGWYLEGAAAGGKTLDLKSISIGPFGILVIMHKPKTESAFQPEDYFVTSSLSISNSNLEITFKDPANNVIDKAGNGSAAEDFAGYSDILKKSMARQDIPGDGADSINWLTTNTQINISADYSYLLYNLATPGANNLDGDLGYNPLDVVVSEIAWAGTDVSPNDEWFELYNNTDADINLAGWRVDGSLRIELYGIIPGHKHFLLERTNDDTVPGLSADLIYTGSLNNQGCIIRLMNNVNIIDDVDMTNGWTAGSNSPKISMERIDLNNSGDSNNWQNGLGDIEGAQNSIE